MLTDQDATCPCCGKAGATLLSLAYDRPDPLPNDAPKHENWLLLQEDGDILTEDFCRMDTYRFVRCVLEIPLLGTTEHLVLGVWGTLSQTNFERYADTFDTGDQAALGNMSSWLSNAVPPGSTLPVAMTMVPRNERQRPQLMYADEEHPLFVAQRDGLSFDALTDLLRDFGHDLTAKTYLN